MDHWTDSFCPWRQTEEWQWGYARGLCAGITLSILVLTLALAL